ncbi:transcriptional regulator, SARP family [Streptantibioticus cattleyicolor NRRL 8057 = DSM 46488]|uniref:Transcriptional regulator, SARP family n=1 Tax=Streptantibioticus cattleyicolor (strain ATCC 35852 / DSM 46488 / JCM 4925 / NBRC 14057 / NRRL 8057) TaxID=1003195 RepID=G8X278_STREN|nr:transcriptional regulator, SARP family [Streptantibioticus cattleyicolor NRRL 8057 = DSM 46488]
MYFGLLGPLDIRHAGRAITLAAGRQRTVLALMLLQANQEVTVESLIKRVWDGEPPSGARNTVQAYVARLRRALRESTGADTLIRTSPGGYVLTVPDDAVDLNRFRALASAGERRAACGELAQAVRDFTAALDLWRGAALQDVPCEVLQRDEAPALEDERLRVTERLCDIELVLGEPAAALARLRAVTAERPLRERPWCQLITALYRCGRRAEALTAYHAVARLLYAELGVEPGPDLREAHACLLADVDIAWPPNRGGRPPALTALPAGPCAPGTYWAAPRQLPATCAELTGRDELVDRATQLLSGQPHPGGVPVVVLTGAPGTGKTALAVHAAHRLAPRFPDGQLFLTLAGACGTPRDPGDLLADALHGTGAGFDAVPPTTAARSAMLRAALAGRRVLLVLDDATDAAQVMPLLPGDPGCAVVVTARTELPELTAFHGAHRLALDPLGPAAAAELLARIAGRETVAAEPEAAAEVAELCGHLPLTLCVAAADLAARRFTSLGAYAAELRAGEGATLLASGTVRAAFDRAYRQLAPPARRLFRLLGTAPLPETDTRAAAVLAGLPHQQAGHQVRQLTAAHLAVEHAPGRLRLPGLLRPYAAGRALAEEDPAELHAARLRLLCWYAARTATAVRSCLPAPAPARDRRLEPFTGPQQARAWLESEAGNLVALARAAHAGRSG